MKPTRGQSVGRRLAEICDDKRQTQVGRRKFFVQAAAIAAAVASPICCGCQTKNSSGTDGDSTRGASHEPPAHDPGSSGGRGSAETVEQRVIEIVAKQMGIPRERVQRTSRFTEDLGADSLDTVDLVMEFEEEFAINIPDSVAVKIQTVGQAIDFVQKLLGDRPVPPRKTERKPRAFGSGSGDRPAKDPDRQKP